MNNVKRCENVVIQIYNYIRLQLIAWTVYKPIKYTNNWPLTDIFQYRHAHEERNLWFKYVLIGRKKFFSQYQWREGWRFRLEIGICSQISHMHVKFQIYSSCQFPNQFGQKNHLVFTYKMFKQTILYLH